MDHSFSLISVVFLGIYSKGQFLNSEKVSSIELNIYLYPI